MITPIMASPVSSAIYVRSNCPEGDIYAPYIVLKLVNGMIRYAMYPASAIFAVRGTERMEKSGSVIRSAKQRTAMRRNTGACATILSIILQPSISRLRESFRKDLPYIREAGKTSIRREAQEQRAWLSFLAEM